MPEENSNAKITAWGVGCVVTLIACSIAAWILWQIIFNQPS